MSRKNSDRSSHTRRGRLSFERLEDRRMLDGDPLEFASWVFIPVTPEEQQIADKVGTDLAWLHRDWLAYQAAGGDEIGLFDEFSAAIQFSGGHFFVQNEGLAAIEVYAIDDANSIVNDLTTLGFQENATYGNGIAGWLPLDAVDDLAGIDGLNFARASYTPLTNVGATDSQGDVAQRTNTVRTTYSVNGAGVDVGVISDSYDIGFIRNPSIMTRAADDVTTGDLAATVNVLNDTFPAQNATDEGRAMLQIVHDVSPGANLAFHTSGVSQQAMRNAILNLQNAGSDVIVDDIIFLNEPMFQDGIVAQTVDQVTAAGVVYASAAGNQARRSYESDFNNSGTNFNIDGTLETAHAFAPGDLFQRVTIPNGATFRVSFQWDAPFASAGGTGANNNLNIYLLIGGTLTRVAQSRTNNIGGDAVELLAFTNNTGLTGTTLFDVLITRAAGADPATIKYVDFSVPNINGQTVAFNEYLTNSSTLYAHANSAGAISVGAARYTQTPPFGVTPPAVENFSAYSGTQIIFNTAGVRLVTPIVREKPNVVGPDGVNTTFFGAADPSGTGVFEADGFPNFFGTSAAAPHVAGLAALMLDAAPNLTPALIGQLLSFTATDMDDPVLAGFQTGFDFATGNGLINGVSAMNATRVSQGDYNGNGVVDAADYTAWRDRLGSSVTAYTSADGNGDGQITQADYDVWKAHFGETFPVPGAGSGSIAAEPASAAMPANAQHSPLAQIPAESFEDVPSVASTPFEAFHTDLLIGATLVYRLFCK